LSPMNHEFAPLWLNRLKKLKLWGTKPHYVGVVVSYPKSGRTWLRVVLREAGVPFAFTHDRSSGSKARPFEELNLFHKQIYAGKPIVFLFRDPRDTAVSAYFWESHRVDNGYAGSMAEFIRDPLHSVEKIMRFNLAWLEQGLNLPAFLPIAYEEIVTTPAEVVRRILGFVGERLSESMIQKVVANNTFEKMHQREGRGVYRKRNTKDRPRRRDSNDLESYKFRRGKSGGYVDYFSPDDIAYCDRILERCRYFEEVDRLTRACSIRPGPK
jgi:hypothetical protein